MKRLFQSRNGIRPQELSSTQNEPFSIQVIKKKVRTKVYRDANIFNVNVPANSTVLITQINPLRTHLAIFNSSLASSVYYGTTLTNCFLAIPPNSERGIANEPLYIGDVYLRNATAVDVVATVYEGIMTLEPTEVL